MVSPYVRRQRLATVLRTLREERGLMADELAKRIHYSRTKISRLENAYGRPDVGDVVKILDVLEIPDEQYLSIVRLASAASAKGWWDRYGDTMGARQRLYVDIESGATTIREYNQSAMPGVLQTPDFIGALINLTKAEGPLDFNPKKMTDARLQRMESLFRPGGPTYEVVVDEVVIRRLTVPPEIMKAQLRHVIKTLDNEPQLTLRVLPLRAQLVGTLLPRATFTLYTFPAAEDPPMAVVDTITADLVYTEPREVERYTRRYDYLSQAALSPDDSKRLLIEAAQEPSD
ncbi:helix-turn-helix transcriptional regulator [Spirillospora sp. NPDC048819]|uniref:helix-turn-helix domain-containing protein n=1 Tax=Spirillospora sp. NPDC048819 TaxID=3155268 RepID=UPI0033E46C6C